VSTSQVHQKICKDQHDVEVKTQQRIAERNEFGPVLSVDFINSLLSCLVINFNMFYRKIRQFERSVFFPLPLILRKHPHYFFRQHP